MTDPTADQPPAIYATPAAVEAALADLQDVIERRWAAAGSHGERPQVVFAVDEAAELVAGQFGQGKTLTARAMLWELARAGYTPVEIDAKHPDFREWVATLPDADADGPVRPAIVAQRANAADVVALAMADHRDVSQGEREAVERGIDPTTYRRLYPAVIGDLADQLLDRIQWIATFLAAHLVCHTDDDRVCRQLTGDPRAAGFRVALFEARRLAATEQMRKLAMFTEWAMTSIAVGDEAFALAKLARADRLLD